MSDPAPARAPWREQVWRIIFEADTPAGKAFDVGLLLAITASIFVVMLESVASVRAEYGPWLRAGEWVFTILFTAEYVLRLACVIHPARYARSFFGVVDVLSILPTYVSLILPGYQSLLVIRSLRLLRIFRVFKLGRYLGGADMLRSAMHASRHKVTVFLGTVVVLIAILGAAMYLLEGAENGFTSIPRSMYWAVVTMTTVGYGDVTPRTIPGQILSACVMILGYAIIAIPTGIVTAEMVQSARMPVTTRSCPVCVSDGHVPDARYCKDCGAELSPPTPGSPG